MKNISEKIIFIFYLFTLFILINNDTKRKNIENSRQKKIGVIGLPHDLNVGNILLKYAMSIQLTSLGFEPYIIGQIKKNPNISYISKFMNIRITQNFLDIKPNDFDILMINSDQTWRHWSYANVFFLKFSQNWNIKKFVYGASIATNKWSIPINIAKNLTRILKHFSGISVRENGTIPLVQKYLGIKPLFVLDPTLLINRKYYLNLIYNYKGDFNIQDKYICYYKLNNLSHMDDFMIKSSKKLNYTFVVIDNIQRRDDYIQRFLLCIRYSKAVITNSYHGTIFSIIFNKPFVVYQIHDDDERLNSLNDIFNIRKRIIKKNEKPNISLLTTPLNINYNKYNKMRYISINFLKNQFFIFEYLLIFLITQTNRFYIC